MAGRRHQALGVKHNKISTSDCLLLPKQTVTTTQKRWLPSSLVTICHATTFQTVAARAV